MSDLKDKVQEFTGKFEKYIEVVAEPIKPLLPAIARFLLVVTFVEDTIRLITQWGDQAVFLNQNRGLPVSIAYFFLFLNIAAMSTGSLLAVLKKQTEVAVGILSCVIVLQSIVYGMIFDSVFFLKNLSVMGGLLMLLADAYHSKRKNLFAGLPTLNETDKSMYIQLTGRILLVFLFMSNLLSGTFTIARIFVTIVGLAGCVMVVVGFKAKYSAWMMIAFLSLSNVVLNSWWSLHSTHPARDFLKYDFFQTLSIIGGFLLLSQLGAGGISFDEKKKQF